MFTRVIGHTQESRNFIATLERLSSIGNIMGAYCEHAGTLYSYKDNTGDVWIEFVQFDHAHNIYLALRNVHTGLVKGWRT
jgi:hypothetical protein